MLNQHLFDDQAHPRYLRTKFHAAFISESVSHFQKAQAIARKFQIDLTYFYSVYELLQSAEAQSFDSIIIHADLGPLSGLNIEKTIRETIQIKPVFILCSSKETRFFRPRSEIDDYRVQILSTSLGFEKIFGEIEYGIKRNKFLRIENSYAIDNATHYAS